MFSCAGYLYLNEKVCDLQHALFIHLGRESMFVVLPYLHKGLNPFNKIDTP